MNYATTYITGKQDGAAQSNVVVGKDFHRLFHAGCLVNKSMSFRRDRADPRDISCQEKVNQ